MSEAVAELEHAFLNALPGEDKDLLSRSARAFLHRGLRGARRVSRSARSSVYEATNRRGEVMTLLVTQSMAGFHIPTC